MIFFKRKKWYLITYKVIEGVEYHSTIKAKIKVKLGINLKNS